ncbi:sulfotransferase [Aliiglaciecola sp. CAU 1673]|uniref:tetratricopeptide repeat-containing sulfotransferase family protein n=1 Tax=Aliiglaciecola sp. CAU 1673 TaxID=3032595 RepID=UPI0023DC45BC|nr:tetratricopeptide repeat-containing sulfotransferase family protein [Aliiglaciecola sp. CAU 1673]MDF2178540.1 sulfotransferase [Aliiglaciecola sp. CAU 1673]
MKTVFEQALARLQASDLEGALNLLSPLMHQGQPDQKSLRLYADCLLQQRQYDQALRALEKLLSLEPDNAQLLNDIAGLHYQAGRFSEAINYFVQATTIQPTLSKAWHFLGICYANVGKMDKAYKAFNQAEECDPCKPQIEQAYNLFQQGNHQDAQKHAQAVLQQAPQHSRAKHLIAMLLSHQGQFDQAAQYVQQALQHSPYNLSLWSLLAQLNTQLADYEEAAVAARRLLEYEPDNLNHRVMLAGILVNAGLFAEAEEQYLQLLTTHEYSDFAHLQLGHNYKTLGETAKAIEHYEKALQAREYKGAAYWGLAAVSSYQFSKQQVQAITAGITDPDIPQEQACQLAFALGRILEQKKDFKGSFKAYRTGNLNKTEIAFDPAKHKTKLQAVKQAFSPEIMSRQSTTKTRDCTPIFVVGMPRAGSTLVEQILASHSQVEATMELKTLPTIARRLYQLTCIKNRNNSGDLSAITPEEFAGFGDLYLELSKVYRSGKPFFIDKLPPNFQHCALIQLILPNAIIIDVRRHPMACGFGIYKQYFAKGHEYAYNLEHIAGYYRDYVELMDHWHSLMPGKIYELGYEKLVENPAAEIGKLLAHCHLPLEQGCLTPHKNNRYVRTASSEQVRQPINDKGLYQWRHYEQDLAPMAKALGEELLARF